MTRTYTYNNIKRCMLAVAMMGSTVCAWAQEPTSKVAKIGDTEYATLQNAIDAANTSETPTEIVLLQSISTGTETYTISKQTTLNLGEFTITAGHTASSDKLFSIASTGNLTVKGTGSITDNDVKGIFYNEGSLTIESGSYTTTNNDGYAVIYNTGSSATCTVSGGTFNGAYAAVYNDNQATMTINNGSFTAASRVLVTQDNATLNITGGTISNSSNVVLARTGSKLNVSGGTITAPNTSNYQAIEITGVNTQATISGGNISGYNGVTVWKNATLNVNEAATISGTNTAISGNGTEGDGGTAITINGGTITSDDTGIYHPQVGTLTIAGGAITGGKLGVEIRAGELSVTGGSITTTADSYSCSANNNGTTTVGAALAIAQHTTKKDITVTISGGTFTGVKAISESNPENNDPAPHVTMSVTAGTFDGGITVVDVQGGFIEGGTYSEAFPAEYCVDGKAPYVDETGACTIITPETEVPADAEALSNGSYYKVLGAAITVAGTEATTITLLKNPAANAITISADANITLIVANEVTLEKPITNSGTLSTSGTISSAITNNGTLTISNGTISGDVTIAHSEATVKIASEVTPLPSVALSSELQNDNVLKSNTTKNSGYTTYWVEKKVDAKVSLSGEPTSEQTRAANTLVSNTAISTVENLATNHSLTITVTSVTLKDSKVTNAVFDVKLIGADGQEVSSVEEPGITFHLPIPSGTEENAWANLWHSTTALTGATVQGSDNKYVAITATSFETFSYEIIATPIAEIGVTKFGTMADAITAAGTADEIKLLADVTENISVSDAKNIKLTIGTHTLSGTITNAGTLVISENTGTISGAITNTDALTVKGGTISGAITASAGSLNISGGTFNNTITTSGTAGLTISNGTMEGTLTVGGSGTNAISGGSFAEVLTVTGGTLTINAGTFNKAGDNAIQANNGTINITGGIFNNTTANAITPTSGSIHISGGTFTTAPVSTLCVAGYLPLKNVAGKFEVKDRWDIVDDTNLSLNPHLANGNYTVKTATYHRNTGMVSAGNAKTKYGTICLPFAIKAALTEPTIKLYTATSIVDNTLTITEVNTYPISAGTPLIFELSAAASTMTVTSSDNGGISVNTTTPATTPATGNLLVGTYQNKVLTSTDQSVDLTKLYYLNGDTFHQAVSSLTVPAFRAYLDTTPAQSGGSNAKPMVLSIMKEGDESTNISAIEALEGVTAVYDLNGRKQNGLQRGMNILRRADGSTIKVIVK